jgi:beta-galactosidase GanA
VRDYCLDDPQWREWARGQVRSIATRNSPHQPLAYNLRDELSTTYSANPFDYDFNPIALAGFRRWLKTQYASLTALNSEWETGFANWDDVTPFTTDEIKNRMSSGHAIPRGKPDWQELESLKFDFVNAQSNLTRWNF